MELNEVERIAVQNSLSGVENKDVTYQNLLVVAYYVIHEMARMFNLARINNDYQVLSKTDGTKSTSVEKDMEMHAKQIFSQYFRDIGFAGEETGGNFSMQGKYWVMDPVDSTNSFLYREPGAAIVCSLVQDGTPVFSVVCNPLTGEIYYAFENQTPRLMTHLPFGGLTVAEDLPINVGAIGGKSNNINFHPMITESTESVRRAIPGRYTRVPGSPVLQSCRTLREANIAACFKWSRESEPWDFAAAKHILGNVPGAGIIGADGEDLPIVGYTGYIVASNSKEFARKVMSALNT